MSTLRKASSEELEEFFYCLPHHRNLLSVYDKIKRYNKKNGISEQHCLMELLVCDYLASRGYTEIDVEYPLGKKTKPPGLVIDVYGRRGREKIGVEIETGNSPIAVPLRPMNYGTARTVAKVVGYSQNVDQFSLAFPPTYRPPISGFLLKPQEERDGLKLMDIKKLTDQYFMKPPFDEEDFMNARLDSIYLINVDEQSVIEMLNGDEHFQDYFLIRL